LRARSSQRIKIEHHNERVPAGMPECFISFVPVGTWIAL
jgi:hypothetical protein